MAAAETTLLAGPAAEGRGEYRARTRRKLLILLGLSIALCLSFAVDLAWGPARYGLDQVALALFRPEAVSAQVRTVVWDIRMPVAVMAIVVGLLLRLVGLTLGDLTLFLAACLQASIVLCVFHLMPIPGLDASWILARFLHGRAREVYTNLNQFLPLFMIVIYFLLGAPVLTFVRFLGNALCGAIVGGDCL